MRLHHVSVANFRHPRIDVDFCDSSGRPLTLAVLAGPNGNGKTTVLDAIHCAYAGISQARLPRWRADLDPFNPRLRPRVNDPWEVKLDFSLDPKEIAASGDLERLLSGKSLGLATKSTYAATVRFMPDGTHTVEGDAEALRGRARVKVALSRGFRVERELETVGGLLYLDQARAGVLAGNENLRITAAPGVPLEREVSRLSQAFVAGTRWDAESRGANPWAYAQHLMARLAPPVQLKNSPYADDGVDLEFTRDGDASRYSMVGTSGGERQVLKLVANFVHERPFHSVILIDEVELNLHARWQRAMLRFCEAGGEANNQFLVTTHSEELMNLCPSESLVTITPFGQEVAP